MNKRVLIMSSAYMRFHAYLPALPSGSSEAVGDSYGFIPGGRGITSVLTFRALGLDSILCSAVGDDSHGRQICRFLEDTGVDRRFIKRCGGVGTGLHMTIHENGRAARTMRFPQANDTICHEDIEAAFMSYPDAVYIQNELSPKLCIFAANLAKNKNVPVFWHPCRPAGIYAEPLPVSLEVAVFDASEVGSYCGVEPTEYEKFLPAAMALASRIKAKYYVIRLPDRGAFIYDGIHHDMAGEYPSTYLDEEGAATVYGAAFCAAYLKTDGNTKKAARCAAAAYAYSSSTQGEITSVPSVKDLVRFLNKDR